MVIYKRSTSHGCLQNDLRNRILIIMHVLYAGCGSEQKPLSRKGTQNNQDTVVSSYHLYNINKDVRSKGRSDVVIRIHIAYAFDQWVNQWVIIVIVFTIM
jgi:hypothetical protein